MTEMLQWAITNMLETNEKIEIFIKEIEAIRKQQIEILILKNTKPK